MVEPGESFEGGAEELTLFFLEMFEHGIDHLCLMDTHQSQRGPANLLSTGICILENREGWFICTQLCESTICDMGKGGIGVTEALGNGRGNFQQSLTGGSDNGFQTGTGICTF